MSKGLINGATLMGDNGDTGEMTGRSVGILFGLDAILEMSFDEEEEEEDAS